MLCEVAAKALSTWQEAKHVPRVGSSVLVVFVPGMSCSGAMSANASCTVVLSAKAAQREAKHEKLSQEPGQPRAFCERARL